MSEKEAVTEALKLSSSIVSLVRRRSHCLVVTVQLVGRGEGHAAEVVDGSERIEFGLSLGHHCVSPRVGAVVNWRAPGLAVAYEVSNVSHAVRTWALPTAYVHALESVSM
jgi:hypothetical protein